jgi:hypothetical protein
MTCNWVKSDIFSKFVRKKILILVYTKQNSVQTMNKDGEEKENNASEIM